MSSNAFQSICPRLMISACSGTCAVSLFPFVSKVGRCGAATVLFVTKLLLLSRVPAPSCILFQPCQHCWALAWSQVQIAVPASGLACASALQSLVFKRLRFAQYTVADSASLSYSFISFQGTCVALIFFFDMCRPFVPTVTVALSVSLFSFLIFFQGTALHVRAIFVDSNS